MTMWLAVATAWAGWTTCASEIRSVGTRPTATLPPLETLISMTYPGHLPDGYDADQLEGPVESRLKALGFKEPEGGEPRMRLVISVDSDLRGKKVAGVEGGQVFAQVVYDSNYNTVWEVDLGGSDLDGACGVFKEGLAAFMEEGLQLTLDEYQRILGPSEPAVAEAPAPTAPAAPAAPAWSGLLTPARTGAASQDAAVVVGLSDYAFLPDVPGAGRDAEAFRQLALYTLGVPQAKLHVVEAGAREQVLAAAQGAGADAGPGGRVWVYVVGHGAPHPDTGAPLVLGDDARDDPASWAARGVALDEIEAAAAAGGANVVLLADASFVGRTRTGEALGGGKRFAIPSYAAQGATSRWLAARDGVAGHVPTADHGLFTLFAVGALRGWADGELDGARDGSVTAGEASAYVQRKLAAAGSNQRPVWSGGADAVLATGVTEAEPTLP